MAGYAKIWTDIFNDEWFTSLSLTERGMWLQLIIFCKLSGDTARINLRSFRAIGAIMGCDGKTARRVLRKFSDNSAVELDETGDIITITLLNYEKHQRLRKASDRGKVAENSATNKTRPDKIKEDNIIKKEPPQAAPEITTADWKKIRTAAGKVFDCDGDRVLGYFKKNRPKLFDRPVLFSWYLLRMFYKKQSDRIENPWQYLLAMHTNGWVVPSLDEGGDDNSFKEHETVEFYCGPILGLPRKQGPRSGELSKI